MSFSKIDNRVLAFTILTKLSIKDLNSVRQTCTKCNNVINETKILTNQISVAKEVAVRKRPTEQEREKKVFSFVAARSFQP